MFFNFHLLEHTHALESKIFEIDFVIEIKWCLTFMTPP